MRRRRGFIMVQALLIIAGLVALMAALAATQRATLQQTQDRLRERRAEAAARSAVARAMAALEEADTNKVTLLDDWATLGENGDTEFELDGATFRLEIVDAGSMINVNLATEEQLEKLPLDTVQIESLLDWREEGTSPRPDGAKDEYYGQLTEPYNARLGRMPSLSELLLVRGWTASTLYTLERETESTATPPMDAEGNEVPLAAVLTATSGAPNTRADGSARINFGQTGINPVALVQMGINPQQALTIAAGAPYTSFQQLLARAGTSAQILQQLLDAATFSTATRLEGKINLNTATQSVLETLPNMTTDIASAIVTQQSSGFNSLGEIATLSGVPPATLAQIADSLTIGSDTWIVRAYGVSGGVGVALEAVVGKRDDRMRVLSWERTGGRKIPAWWSWEEEPMTTVDAGAGS